MTVKISLSTIDQTFGIVVVAVVLRGMIVVAIRIRFDPCCVVALELDSEIMSIQRMLLSRDVSKTISELLRDFLWITTLGNSRIDM